MDEARLRDLDAWLATRGLKPTKPGDNVPLSSCPLEEDGDFRKVIELARSAILGNGARAARIGVKGTVLAGVDAELRLDGRCLEFEELELSLTGGKK